MAIGTLKIENYVPVVKLNQGIYTTYDITTTGTITASNVTTVTDNLDLSGTLDVTGVATFDDDATVAGDLAVAGSLNALTSVEVVTTTNILTAAESGKTCILNSATGFVSTLPAVASAGAEFTFVIGGTPPSSGNHTVVTATGNTIHGLVIYAPTDDAGAVDDNANTVSFVASQAQEGDWVTLISDGTNWLVRGQAQVAEGVTLTTE